MSETAYDTMRVENTIKTAGEELDFHQEDILHCTEFKVGETRALRIWYIDRE
jgi:hypothetical protein